MEKEPPKPSNHQRHHHGSKASNHHQRERLGLGIPSDDDAAAHHRSHEQSRETASSASDFLLRWGNRKRLRCMKMNKFNSPSPVHKSTTDRSDRKHIKDSKDMFAFSHHRSGGGGHFNLRHRNTSPPTTYCALRNSETMRVQSSKGGGGGDSKGAAVGLDMKTQHQKHHNNNENGASGGGSSDHDNKKGVGGGGCSSGSDAVPAVWPHKFVIALTNKEKEEDFMAIKGSKLPQRPKKRAKLIQRTLNSVSPGTWLCDLTLDRYEVREKKTSKKRPRGLKAMGNMESDSDSLVL